MRIVTLKKRKEFVNISNIGKKIFTDNFIFLALENDSTPDIRLGFTASKKIGNAPERNFSKRRLKAALCLAIPQNNVKNYDIVLIARKNILKTNFQNIVENLNYSFSKLNDL